MLPLVTREPVPGDQTEPVAIQRAWPQGRGIQVASMAATSSGLKVKSELSKFDLADANWKDVWVPMGPLLGPPTVLVSWMLLGSCLLQDVTGTFGMSDSVWLTITIVIINHR